MPSPFPGMDPYLEDPLFWPGVHYRLITNAATALNLDLPSSYAADIGERLYVEQAGRSIYPDVLIEELRPAIRTPVRTGGGVAAAERTAPWRISAPIVEHREPFIRILSLKPDRRVVTVIEVLSPANKALGSAGRELYLKKQRELLDSETHLIEIDLLRGGGHTVAPPLEELERRGTWDYLASVHRSPARWEYTVWPILLRETLPQITVPLAGQDPDVTLDLQAVFHRGYEEGAYTRTIDYSGEPPTPLREEDRQWAQNLLRERGLRP